MNNDRKHRVCPVEKAGSLEGRLRRWVQNPRRILKPYVHAGMDVLDFGCGPGFFSLELARLVGAEGHVIAADLQPGMLDKLHDKIRGTDLEERITLHTCQADSPGIGRPVDFVLAFYVLHEVPDQAVWFEAMAGILKTGGTMLIVEPLFHVSQKEFKDSIDRARRTGLKLAEPPKVRLRRRAVFQKP